MIDRKKDSHKGDNGKVMIIGGNEMFHGAPILSALGAEYSGVDLVFPFIPKIHTDSAKTHSLNFIINTFEEDHLTAKDVKNILNFSKKVDAVVIGPGLGTNPQTKSAVKELLKHLNVPTVVDASALMYSNTFPKTTVLTPHRGEFKELTGDDPTPKNIQKWAKSMSVTIVCKGPEDIIADKDELAINKTGNAMMTVGGTGDVLSGLIGGLIAQGLTPFDSGKYATEILGKTAESLADNQGSIRAVELAYAIPTMIKN